MSKLESHPLVGVVILAYNNVADTVECVQSVLRLNYPKMRVIVVDNGSTDGTTQAIHDRFPNVEVVKLAENVGVPGGFNQGIIQALQEGAEYVLLLNNDTIVAPDMLERLVAVGQDDSSYGILMPKVLYYAWPRTVWSLGARYRRFPPAIVFVGLGQPDDDAVDVRSIEYAPSCGLLISRETFCRIGLFDPGYLFYFDDWDFCDRARASGLRIGLVSGARMWHKVSRTIRRRPENFWRTWGESCVRYYRRHGRPVYLSLPVHFGYILLREFVKGNGRSLGYFLLGGRSGLRKPLTDIPMLSSREPSRAE